MRSPRRTNRKAAGFRVAIPLHYLPSATRDWQAFGLRSPRRTNRKAAGFRVAIPLNYLPSATLTGRLLGCDPRPLRQAFGLPSPTRHTRTAGTERTDDLQRPTLPINERDFHSRYPGVFPGATSRSGTCPPHSREYFFLSLIRITQLKLTGMGPFQNADGHRRSELRAQPSHRNRLPQHKASFLRKTSKD